MDERKKNRAWTEIEIDLVRKLTGEGKPNREIAFLLERSIKSVQYIKYTHEIGTAKRRHTPPREWTESEILLVGEWRRQRKSCQWIALQLNRMTKEVTYLLLRHPELRIKKGGSNGNKKSSQRGQ